MSWPWTAWLLRARAGRASPSLGTVFAEALRAWMGAGDTLLIDIREPGERGRRCISGAVSLPLSRYPSRLSTAAETKRVVFRCRSGKRTRLAARRLAASTALPAYALADGLNGWDQA